MLRRTCFLFVAVLAGCASLEPNLAQSPQAIPASPIDSEPEDKPGEILEKTPTSIQEPQSGSDTAFKKGDGFFYTIGEGVVSLGDPRRGGIWIRAPFVEDGTTVEIHSRETGLSVHAEAGTSDGILQMSLGAFQALKLSPAGLPTIEVRTP